MNTLTVLDEVATLSFEVELLRPKNIQEQIRHEKSINY